MAPSSPTISLRARCLGLGLGAVVAMPLIAEAGSPCTGEDPEPSTEEARFTWLTRPLTVSAGAASRLTIDLLVPEGFHVFRDDIHVSVLDAGGLVVGQPVLPVLLVANAQAAVDAHPVRYEGGVHIELPVDATSTEPGLRLLHLQAEVRGCSARRCHQGTKEHLDVYVHVVARDADPASR